jgi:hypothetical protein
VLDGQSGQVRIRDQVGPHARSGDEGFQRVAVPLRGPGDPSHRRAFLRERVHRRGSLFSTAEVVERATGAPLSSEPLIAHLTAKAALWG